MQSDVDVNSLNTLKKAQTAKRSRFLRNFKICLTSVGVKRVYEYVTVEVYALCKNIRTCIPLRFDDGTLKTI